MALNTSLSSAFQSLLKPPAASSPYTSYASKFAVPAAPAPKAGVTVGPYRSVAPVAAPAPMPVIPKVSAVNAANAHTGANASYINPANATASKGTVPFVPSTQLGGGKSVVPTQTSLSTKLPAAPNVRGAVTPSNAASYVPPQISAPKPATTKSSTTASSPTTSSFSSAPAMPSFSTTRTPSAPSSSTPGSTPFGGSAAGTFGSPSQTPFYTPSPSTYSPGSGSLPAGWSQDDYDAFKKANPNLEPTAEDTQKKDQADPYGLGLFMSSEQAAAQKAYQQAIAMSPAEEAAMKHLNDLNASFATSYANTAGQPIALPFITGQQAQLQRSKAAMAQPLESEIALLQAKRQLAGTASKTALDLANERITAFRDYNKPVGVTAGTSLINPLTGKTIASGMSLADKNALDTFFNIQQTYPDAQIAWDPSKSAQENLQNAQAATSNSPKYQASYTTIRSVQLPGGGLGFYNSKDGNIYDNNGQKIGNIGSGANTTVAYDPATGATLKADAASLTKQQEYADSTERAFNTANNNLGALTTFMSQYGLNDSNVPLVNQLNNKVKAKLADPGAVAAFNAALAGLRAEYALVLSRGGEVTDSQRNAAATLIPDTLSPQQLQMVAARLNTEGSNAIKEARAQVEAIRTRMAQGSNFGKPTSGSPPAGVPQGWGW